MPKQRSYLEAVESDIWCALSKITPIIEKLVNDKRIQSQEAGLYNNQVQSYGSDSCANLIKLGKRKK